MGRAIIVIILAVALAIVAAWHFELFPREDTGVIAPANPKDGTVPPEALGSDLYDLGKFKPIALPKTRASIDPIVLHGVMNAFEIEEVPSKVQGTVLFIGERVDESAVLVAGSAAFVAEPYYFTTVFTGRQTFTIFYRRLYEGQTVKQGQMLFMVDPPEALGTVLEKIAKISAAEAEHGAAIYGEKEGWSRYERAKLLYSNKSITAEDLGAALLTWKKLESETVNAREKVKLTEIEKDQADVKLRMHEGRAVLPYKTYTIKTIHRPAGTFLKQLDPVVMTVQNLERLLAEASIEEQYYTRFKDRKHVTATIEPTVLEAPTHEWHGHDGDVTCVAVARDMRIVSGSVDRSVCVWKPHEAAMQRKFEHDEPVKSLACTPKDAKDNLCVVGCSDGSIWLWDLDGVKDAPLKKLDKPHGHSAITAVAFSPDGKYFATGAEDGSIRLWTTETAEMKYAFVPKNGVEHCHEDAVTSLHFTPQSRLISAGQDKTLRVWVLKELGATPDGKALRDREGNVRNLGVSQDGQWMLFDQGRTLRFLSVENRKLVHSINLPPNSQPFDTLTIFSPDGTLLLTAGAPEGRLQLWRTPLNKPAGPQDAPARAFEVRQFAPRERDRAVACAAFSPEKAIGDVQPFAVSGSGQKVYLWSLPTPTEVKEHRLENIPLTIKSQTLDTGTRTTRIGFEVANPPVLPRYPNGRFEAGRPVTIVID